MLGDMKGSCCGNGIKIFHSQIMHTGNIEFQCNFVQITKFTLNEIEEFVLFIIHHHHHHHYHYHYHLQTRMSISHSTYLLLEQRTAHNQRTTSFRKMLTLR